MPKRKSAEAGAATTPSLASYDAALDLLACEMFGRLESLTSKFEAAAGVKLNEGVVMRRWEEASKRYLVMKSMDELTCGGKAVLEGSMVLDGDGGDQAANGDSGSYARPLPKSHHPGAVRAFELDADEELQWRRWSPRVNDMVLVELQAGAVWPAKIIEKKTFFQGRSSIPRGNNFYAVRVYTKDMEPTMTVKSRLIPLELRSSPPPLATTELITAYNHALNPTAFDVLAVAREQAAAYARTHPGAGDEDAVSKLSAEKDSWKKFVNWLMDERRVEKLRNLSEERDKRLREVTTSSYKECDPNGCDDDLDNGRASRRRRVSASLLPFAYSSTKTVHKVESESNERGGIFRIAPLNGSPSSSQGSSSNSSRSITPMSSYIRPALSVPLRPNSPRRADRRRNGVFAGLGEFSPRRGSTYTPPRVLPSGDETAPFSPSPAPSLKSFEFCSPLGNKYSKSNDDDVVMVPKNGSISMGSSLEAVKEEDGEDGDWTVVSKSGRYDRTRRTGSEPYEKAKAVAPSTSIASRPAGPPALPPTKFSPQPIADRQKALRTLYTQFEKLYSQVLPQYPSLAQESAVDQESEVSATTRNVKAYKMAIHQAAVSISRRAPPDSVPHVSIGTVKQCRETAEAAEVAKASKLTVDRIGSFCHDTSTLIQWGYPDYGNAELIAPPVLQSEITERQDCDRCKKNFDPNVSYELGSCVYHYGRPRPERKDGRRVWLYTCCGKERGGPGCEDGIHVFSFREDDSKLAALAPYQTTQQLHDQHAIPARRAMDIVGMDCEMIYTAEGTSLARVTIVDENGEAVLDELVRQRHRVLDCNTRFSGVVEKDLESAAMDLDAVRKAACSFIGPQTIVVGHGLENDLRALRLLHDRVIDTAILFPHPNGPPYRRALRDLVKDHLGYFIQDNSAAGHSSAEDARATIEVLKAKVRGTT
ncbi:hypothetical protein CspeluHIS016_0202810 [Cutaneotrichosporon spelunceum]|uniref:Exonuclease domain-containing protein n=1 Tax=Cutaneotrichosporon spelunceum TaxID=1672016 RepID=A0AAD3TRS6_9TREE|nr:hypothetical protein CspeluHIS016_0202810 [Cutaneotrichosporon spelunceum]